MHRRSTAPAASPHGRCRSRHKSHRRDTSVTVATQASPSSTHTHTRGLATKLHRLSLVVTSRTTQVHIEYNSEAKCATMTATGVTWWWRWRRLRWERGCSLVVLWGLVAPLFSRGRSRVGYLLWWRLWRRRTRTGCCWYRWRTFGGSRSLLMCSCSSPRTVPGCTPQRRRTSVCLSWGKQTSHLLSRQQHIHSISYLFKIAFPP